MRGLIISNDIIANGTYRMAVECRHEFIRPGQFAQISIPGVFLRRPISVSDWGEGWFSVIYRVVGRGTDILSTMRPSAKIDVLTGLGNGFTPCGRALIIAGGMGVAPMYKLAKSLVSPDAALGFKTADEVYYTREIESVGARVRVATQDGSLGEKGLVTDIIAGEYDSVYVCGPTPMMRAIHKVYPGAYFSLEERMACGFGACMGCAVETRGGMRRVCADGPVFRGGDLLW